MKTVALLLDDPGNQYQQLLVREARSQAARQNLRVLDPEFGQGSSWTQLETVQAFLRKPTGRPDGVVVMLAGGQMTASAFARLAKADIAMVFVNRVPPWIDDLRVQFPKALVAAVAPRQRGIGEVQARHAFRLARPGSFVLMVTGEARSQAAIERHQGFLETAGSRFDVHALDGRWSAEGAAQVVEEWFRVGAKRDVRIELVVCHNDAMAKGVRTALARQGSISARTDLAHVPIVGCDGLESEGLAMVARGELAGTVVLPTTTPPALKILRRFWDSAALSGTVQLEATAYPPLAEAAS
ncbi:MAG: sugar ABC transporter substrate-binding protein [Vicinamibacteria bacterium]